MKFTLSLFIAISVLCFSTTLAAPTFHTQNATQTQGLKELSWHQKVGKTLAETNIGKTARKALRKAAGYVIDKTLFNW
jgi:hypothetical protein